jgi:hypothetical protein
MSQFFVKDNSSSGADVETLTGNTGGPVGPDGAFNIDVIGSGAVSVSGDPVTNTLTISVGGAGLVWQRITGSGALAINNGYIAVAPGGALTLSLPVTSNTGDIIEVVLNGATSWQITQGAGQQIRVGNTTTTLGAGGSITSTAQGDGIRIVCDTANTLWVVTPSPIGVLTVV